MPPVLPNNRSPSAVIAAQPEARSCGDLAGGRGVVGTHKVVIGTLTIGLLLGLGCTAGRPWLSKWGAGDDGGLAEPSPAEREALRQIGEDSSLSNRRRAAAWLRGAVGLLPPTVETVEAGTAGEWLQRASTLDPEEGGPGAVARTLLALLASISSEKSNHAAAVKRTAECRERLEALDKAVGEARRELETLKAIDLAPLPGEPKP